MTLDIRTLIYLIQDACTTYQNYLDTLHKEDSVVLHNTVNTTLNHKTYPIPDSVSDHTKVEAEVRVNNLLIYRESYVYKHKEKTHNEADEIVLLQLLKKILLYGFDNSYKFIKEFDSRTRTKHRSQS